MPGRPPDRCERASATLLTYRKPTAMPRCLLENRVGSQDYGSADGERAGHRSGQVRELIGLSSSLVRPGSGRERERRRRSRSSRRAHGKLKARSARRVQFTGSLRSLPRSPVLVARRKATQHAHASPRSFRRAQLLREINAWCLLIPSRAGRGKIKAVTTAFSYLPRGTSAQS